MVMFNDGRSYDYAYVHGVGRIQDHSHHHGHDHGVKKHPVWYKRPSPRKSQTRCTLLYFLIIKKYIPVGQFALAVLT